MDAPLDKRLLLAARSWGFGWSRRTLKLRQGLGAAGTQVGFFQAGVAGLLEQLEQLLEVLPRDGWRLPQMLAIFLTVRENQWP